jgi:hypothetical protein
MPGLQPRAGPLQAISGDGNQNKGPKLLCKMPCRKNTERSNRHNAARLAWPIARHCFRNRSMTKSDSGLQGGLRAGLTVTNTYPGVHRII